MFSFHHVFDHPMARGFPNRFSTQYRCYSVSMLAGPNDRSDVEKGGKSECRREVCTNQKKEYFILKRYLKGLSSLLLADIYCIRKCAVSVSYFYSIQGHSTCFTDKKIKK
ncbi:hypothetical protein XENOCAPTIV_018713 [Xenoophorus captivus]|uniref:Uncharacterized protein n=1 Tax=Xenoophorus captivus TaxID=1517983 RepID=A0ABV0QXE3_9TELE